MNKLTTLALFSLLIHSLSFATTISGASARQLYGFLKTDITMVDDASVKKIGTEGFLCQEKRVINDHPFPMYEYTCMLGDIGRDGRIDLGTEIAQSLFEEMGRKFCKETLRTDRHMNTLIRKLLAVECREQDIVGGATNYKCSIEP